MAPGSKLSLRDPGMSAPGRVEPDMNALEPVAHALAVYERALNRLLIAYAVSGGLIVLALVIALAWAARRLKSAGGGAGAGRPGGKGAAASGKRVVARLFARPRAVRPELDARELSDERVALAVAAAATADARPKMALGADAPTDAATYGHMFIQMMAMKCAGECIDEMVSAAAVRRQAEPEARARELARAWVAGRSAAEGGELLGRVREKVTRAAAALLVAQAHGTYEGLYRRAAVA